MITSNYIENSIFLRLKFRKTALEVQPSGRTLIERSEITYVF